MISTFQVESFLEAHDVTAAVVLNGIGELWMQAHPHARDESSGWVAELQVSGWICGRGWGMIILISSITNFAGELT